MNSTILTDFEAYLDNLNKKNLNEKKDLTKLRELIERLYLVGTTKNEEFTRPEISSIIKILENPAIAEISGGQEKLYIHRLQEKFINATVSLI